MYTTNIICESSSLQTVSPIADNSSFELTPTCDGAVATVTGLAGGTFTFAEEPTDGAVIDSGSGLVTGGDFGSEYQISYTTNGICPTSTILFINVNNPPTINEPTALDVCDDNIADGIVEMDLNIKNSEITNGNPNYSVSYFISEEDALSNSNPLSNLYTNISNPQTIYVSVTDIITNCFTTTSLELNVISPPIVGSPPNLEFCDADADGFGVFDLTQLNDFISDGQNGLTISYHETASDAQNNIFPIVGEYNNIVAYEQTIYVRVESESVVTDCATYLSTQIVVNDKPQIDFNPLPFEVCDDEIEDGFTIIDLSQTNEQFLNGLDPSNFTITYYETQENAENTENAIVSPFAYTNISAFNQVIWIHVEDSETGCFNITSLELIINDLPQLIQPTPLNLCDDNNPGDEVEEFTLEDRIEEVLQGQTGIEVTFYTTQENADSATNPISSPYTNTSNPQTIYIRGEYEDTGCHSTITLDLRVNPIPSPAAAEPIEECDEDNDGFTFFTIDANEVEIINGELDVFLSYYETIDNAENAVDPIFSPYYNILSDGQTIFIRAENALTGCFTIIEQELITKPSPELPVIIEDIEVCDDDYDEITVFDLTQRDEDIYGDQSTIDFTLTYHESLLDAETGDDPIVSTTSYQNLSNPQTIYVRLEGFDNSCVSIGEFNLLVSLPPVIQQPTPLEECDDEVADQITEFDLTSKNDEITVGNMLWDVVYYETEQDALDNINAIENPEAYTNTSVGGNPFNPQTLFVAITNELGCVAYTTLTIKVLPNPTPNIDPVDLELCDYDNPGDQVEVFDITLNEAYIIDGEPGVSITYYESLNNAITETDVIVDPTNYTNTTPGQQTIYARVTNDATGCYTMVDFDVIVNVVPNIAAVGDIIACEVNTDNFYEFDLDSVTDELLGSQDPVNFTVTYYEDLVDAENGINAITSPYTNLTNPQELFVNITSDITGCFIIGGAFNIEVQEAAIANGDGVPAEISICEDDASSNDGIMEFDLTELDTQILDGQDPVNFTVTYYETLEDANNGVNALATTYENISNPQVIFARVDNDTTIDSQCYAIAEATLEVNLLPEFTLEDLYIACVDVNGSELVESSLMEIDLSPTEHTFEWFDPTDTLVATTQSYTPLMSGTYTAVATSLKGCKYYVTTEVSGSSPAIVEALVTTLAFAEEHVIEANAVGTGDYEYSLDDGPWQLDGTFTDVSAGIHTVTVRDLNGCGIGIKTVLVIDYPRFFTPNGDGYNDTWQIAGIDTRPLSKIYIFDRYGKLLKELSPTGEGWDGNYNGYPLPATDYWFMVEYEEPGTEIIKTFRAHFSLKR
jgi:gliding motility-associated-like protein